ncbi:SDR family NAD(P)-dependent oxidoreductase [Micromonospora sp. RP3T]|uniref:SDR family NAD(P)-dependent oxidoreductase n=1 Tax=Micromonospora sp. RP3T TaxID=2135446 RepID=UPI003D7024EF
MTTSDTHPTPAASRSRAHQRFLERYGPTALVTGASSGIGREIAHRLAERGLDLVLVARRESELRELAADLTARHGIHAQVLPLDLARPESIDALAAATAGADIGLCVAAAGFGTSGPFIAAELPRELEMLQVNCAATLALSWLFGRRFADRGRGGIILLSSIVSFQGAPNAANYAATKAYVQTLAEGLHAELRPHGVDVLASAPGPVASGFADTAGMRMGRTLTPEDVARRSLDALGRRPTAFPGLLSRILKDSLAPLPRRARVRVMGGVMAGMTKHRR